MLMFTVKTPIKQNTPHSDPSHNKNKKNKAIPVTGRGGL
jgi:hypothetical protein